MKFMGLEATHVAEKTARFYFSEVNTGVEPWVEVRPATQSNHAYFNAMVMMDTADDERNGRAHGPVGRTRGRAARSEVRAKVSDIVRQRKQERALYAKHVLVGWGGWKDAATGEEVPFSVDAARDLLDQLSDHLFDQLRAFCNVDANFSTDPEPDDAAVESLAGN